MKGSSAAFMTAAMGARVWYEWFESKAKRSDAASRPVDRDTQERGRAFAVRPLQLPTWPWAAIGRDLVQRVRAVPRRAALGRSSAWRPAFGTCTLAPLPREPKRVRSQKETRTGKSFICVFGFRAFDVRRGAGSVLRAGRLLVEVPMGEVATN